MQRRSSVAPVDHSVEASSRASATSKGPKRRSWTAWSIIGDLKAEGTIFSLNPQSNITTNDDFIDFFNTVFFRNLTRAQVSSLTDLYSENPAAGSPFGSGDANEIGSQYKRLAAVQGEYVLESSRRDLLNYTYSKQAAYTYFIDQSVYVLGQISELADLTGPPIIGSFHASDVLLNDFGLVPATISENTKNIMAT